MTNLPPTHALVVSAHAHRRREHALDWLRGRATRSPLVLAPNRGAADDLALELASVGGGLGVERLTTGQLASAVASAVLAAEGRAPLSEIGAEALATLLAARAADAGELLHFGPVARLPGFPRALRRTLLELRGEGIEAPALAALDEAPASDLGALLRGYERELEQGGLADYAALLRAAAALLRELAGGASGPKVEAARRFAGRPHLWLDLDVSRRLDEELLGSCAAVAGELLWTVSAHDVETLRAARAILGTAPRDLDRDTPVRDRLARAQRFVFASRVEEQAPPVDSSESFDTDTAEVEAGEVVFFTAGGEGQECVEIARRIRDLAAEGVPFDRIAVAVRQPGAYLPLLEDALGRARIPAAFARGSIRPDPAGRAFLALLACAAEGLSASRFAEYLSLGQIPQLDAELQPVWREVPWVEPEGDQFVLSTLESAGERREESARPDEHDVPETHAAAHGPEDTEDAEDAEAEGLAEDAASPAPAGTLPVPLHWERLLVDAAVVGGVDRWRRRLDGLARELERRVRELGDEERPRRAAIERDLSRLSMLRRFALPVIEELAVLPAASLWGEWLGHLESLAARTLRRPHSVAKLLAELRPMAAVGPVTLGEVQQALGERLATLQQPPPRRRWGKVLVCTVADLRGRSFDAVFVPGLAEGVFPRRASEDPLLLDELRRKLARADSSGRALQTQDDRVRQERGLLHVAVSAARRRLYASYPRVDVLQGRVRVPSFYALDLLRAARGSLPSRAELEEEARDASASPIGWPAPFVPERGIDDAEYDLSLLRPLLHAPEEEVRGQGRFLLSVSEPLARSLRSRARRWRSSWSYADGLVLEPGKPEEGGEHEGEAAELLSRHRLSERSFSATALQNFAACPYRFALQAVHRLRPRVAVAGFEQLDPLTRGSIFHEVQYELLTTLREEALLPVTSENLERAISRCDAVLTTVAERVEEDLAPAIRRVWLQEVDDLRSDLRGWLQRVAEDEGSWRPLHFELAFGMPHGQERDPASRDEPVRVLDRLSLRGAIDLVEEDRAGGRLRVTDHKTGRARAERGLVVGKGEVLQPLLYALAAEQALPGPERSVSAGRLFYCTQRGGYEAVEVELGTAGRSAVLEVVEAVDEAIADGRLPAAPREGACMWCDYRLVCGPYEEQRVARKRGDALARLERIRSMR
ncbi:MAG TPA: PD-(D/E)XK nuclease family protein [Thermoanaerobaculia bacterium]|nr:PD-(D/E)XK nuclease family protein [Thermoanaerobaculia bacterium]